jgi:hypothetical protein
MKNFYYFISLFVILGCTKEIALDVSEVEDTIAVNCLFTDDLYFKVLVAKTIAMTDTIKHFVSNATVTIKAQKSNIERTLRYQGEGLYFDTTYFPEYDETYQLTVEVPGYKTLSATDSLPFPPDVSNVYLISTTRYDVEVPNYRYHDIYITLNDPAHMKNYYEMICYELEKNETFVGVGLESEEPIIVDEGDQNLYYGPLLLSDEVIDGKELEFKVTARCNIDRDTEEWNTSLHIASISGTLYRYRKQEIRHLVSGYEFWNPIEPVPMYSNIKNGYGIFAGYSSHCFLLQHENK